MEMFPSPSGELQQFIHSFQIFIKRHSDGARDRRSLFKNAVPQRDSRAGEAQWSFAAATADFLMRCVSRGLQSKYRQWLLTLELGLLKSASYIIPKSQASRACDAV